MTDVKSLSSKQWLVQLYNTGYATHGNESRWPGACKLGLAPLIGGAENAELENDGPIGIE